MSEETAAINRVNELRVLTERLAMKVDGLCKEERMLNKELEKKNAENEIPLQENKVLKSQLIATQTRF